MIAFNINGKYWLREAEENGKIYLYSKVRKHARCIKWATRLLSAKDHQNAMLQLALQVGTLREMDHISFSSVCRLTSGFIIHIHLLK